MTLGISNLLRKAFWTKLVCIVIIIIKVFLNLVPYDSFNSFISVFCSSNEKPGSWP